MKLQKLLCTAASAAMLFTCFTGCKDKNASEKTKAEGKFSKPISAVDMAKDMGLGLNLGNTMEAYDANGCELSTY